MTERNLGVLNFPTQVRVNSLSKHRIRHNLGT